MCLLMEKLLVIKQIHQKYLKQCERPKTPTVRDIDYANKDHFLTSQQISGFFSRLARKKALHSNDSARNDETDDEDDLDVDEQEIHELADKVNNAIGLKHPIVSGAFNICELSKKSKLTGFSISMLKEFCSSLELDTSHITARLKKPYVELINNVVGMCSCSKKDS